MFKGAGIKPFESKVWLANIAEWSRMYDKIKAENQCVSLKTLKINGRDLIGMGVKPGPQLGQYYDISGTPTCGLATAESVLTVMDDPRVFWEPDRINAQLLWFTQGHVAYRVPDYLNEDQKLVELEVSFEIASEAPDFADDWPSDISFYMNGIRLFTWISPGDFGVKRGILTPEWWPSNQYGLLKTVRILPDGTYLDGERVSEITLEDVSAARQQFWDIRFEIAEDAEHVGGISLFGKQFGNYAQDIVMRVFFEKITEE